MHFLFVQIEFIGFGDFLPLSFSICCPGFFRPVRALKAKLGIYQLIRGPVLTSSHKPWFVTKRMKLEMWGSEISFLCRDWAEELWFSDTISEPLTYSCNNGSFFAEWSCWSAGGIWLGCLTEEEFWARPTVRSPEDPGRILYRSGTGMCQDPAYGGWKRMQQLLFIRLLKVQVKGELVGVKCLCYESIQYGHCFYCSIIFL